MLHITPLRTDTIYLLRHAEAEGPALSDPLTAHGIKAAETMAATLASLEIDAVFCSPALRARQTVRPFAEQAGLTITQMPDLREHRLSLQSPHPEDPMHQLRFAQRALARPGGESFNAVAARFRTALRSVSRRPYIAPLMVTHGGVLASVMSQLDRNFGFEAAQAMPRPALFKLTHKNGSPTGVESVPCSTDGA